MITGLVAITPAAGVVAGWGAIIIGVVSGSLPWFTMNILGPRLALFRAVDDTLGNSCYMAIQLQIANHP
jgi:Amt family ammonium transporter